MGKKLIFVMTMAAAVSTALALSVDDHYSEEVGALNQQAILKVDIEANGYSEPNDTQHGWKPWEMSGIYGPLPAQIKNFDGTICQLEGYTATGGAGNLGGSRNRLVNVPLDGGDLEGVLKDLAYVAHTAPGMGKDYFKLTIRLGSDYAGWNVDVTLYNHDIAFDGNGLVYSAGGDPKDSKRVAWSTTNPAQWLTDNGYDPNGYGYPAGPYVPGVTESNMPAGLMALSSIALEQGTWSGLYDYDGATGATYGTTVNVTLDDVGRVVLYGWADMLTGTGSQHAVLNGFVVSIPEPATIALLGLGGLALIRRKR